MTKRHMLLMLACCLIPLAALGAIYALELPINSTLYFGIMLVCPLLHFILMRSAFGNSHHAAHSYQAEGTARGARIAAEHKQESAD